jgi:hypothetical protein
LNSSVVITFGRLLLYRGNGRNLTFFGKNTANFGKVYILTYNFLGKMYFFVAIYTEKCIFADEKL